MQEYHIPLSSAFMKEKLAEDRPFPFPGLGQNTEDTGLGPVLAEDMTARITKGTMQTLLLHPTVCHSNIL